MPGNINCVALGRDLRIAGEATADAVALNGNAAVTGKIAGDLIVLGGDARLGESARVEGDVFVLGGSLEAEPGARIDGRSVSYPTISSAWLTLIEGPSLGLPAMSPVVLGAKLAPIIPVGVVAGFLLTRWMKGHHYRWFIYTVLLVASCTLVVKAFS